MVLMPLISRRACGAPSARKAARRLPSLLLLPCCAVRGPVAGEALLLLPVSMSSLTGPFEITRGASTMLVVVVVAGAAAALPPDFPPAASLLISSLMITDLKYPSE